MDSNDAELSKSFQGDEQDFRDNYVSDVHHANKTQLDAKLVFSSHSMEKSLSNDNFEIGHGFSVARVLVDLLDVYNQKRFPKDAPAYVNTLAVLKCFYKKHEGSRYQKSIEEAFGGLLAEILACQSLIGGTSVLHADSKKGNSLKNFSELADGRFTVREYADEPVDIGVLHEVIRIAQRTPSACNRQPARVYYLTDKSLIAKVLEIQGGFAHYATPPVLFLVTATDNAYVAPNERNQGYVDGGLYVMSLLYALEYEELAACPLHAMFDADTRNTIRDMFGIPDSEKLISFVAAGHFKPESKVCKSFRYPIEHVSRRIDSLYEPHAKAVSFQTDRAKDVEIRQLSAQLVQARAELQSHLGIKRSARLLAGNIKRKLRIRTRLRNLANMAKTRSVDGTIVTLTGFFNYGNIMQRYALQAFLRDNKLNYVVSQHITGPTDSRIIRDTKLFCQKRIHAIDIDIHNPKDMFRSYIVGSDQVWRDWGNEPVEYYFLNFVRNQEAKKVAYAVSFGKDSLLDAGVDRFRLTELRVLATQFSAISVREISGASIVQNELGVPDSAHVLDPTMLLTKDDYSQLIEEPVTELAAIYDLFVYVLDDDARIQELVTRIADQKQYKVSKIAAEFDKQQEPVELWLKGFRDAKFVVTDSYHGMLFSIINNTDFVVIANEARGLARFTSLLGLVGLEDRLVSHSEIDEAMKKLDQAEIDWHKVNMKLEELRRQSAEWLLNALQGVK